MGPDLIIDPALRRQFARDGYAQTPLLTAEDVAELLAFYREASPPMAAGFYTTLWSEKLEYRQKAHEAIARVLDRRLRSVLRPAKYVLTQFAVKQAAHAETECPLHQDWSLCDEQRSRSIHLWFPLIDVDQQNGCLEVVGGSHRVSRDHRSHSDRCRFDDLAPALRMKYTTPIPLRAGQGIVYDGALLHASAHNRSSRRRVAVGTVLVPDDAQIIHAYRISPTAVEVFAVDDPFFWRHQPGARPQDVSILGVMDSLTSQHGEEALHALAVR